MNSRTARLQAPGAVIAVVDDGRQSDGPGTAGRHLRGRGECLDRQSANRMEENAQFTVPADRYDGMRLNSPNDLACKSDGALYFTDPPFGLPKFFDDPRKELPYRGVFRVSPEGRLQFVNRLERTE